MIILLFYSRNQGYLSQFFEEVSVRMAEDGHEVHNFSLKSEAYTESKNNVHLTVAQKGGYFRNYYEVFKIIKTVKPDVVLSNFSYVNPALLFGKLFGVRNNIIWFHSLNAQTGATTAKIFVKRLFLKLADIVIANSHHTKLELQSAFHVPVQKIKTVPFWSPIEGKGRAKPKPFNSVNLLKIGCPGRLVGHKNQGIVLDALAYFDKSPYQLHIAGTGSNQTRLETQAVELGIDSHIVFRGHLSATAMISFYKEMDLIILPSLAEAFGLVFIEAISLGTPVIVSSKFGALTFMEPTETLKQITFDPHSKDSLIEKLNPYFTNQGFPPNCFKKLYEENFDKHLIYNRLQSIMRKE